jgi:hypothetical protein
MEQSHRSSFEWLLYILAISCRICVLKYVNGITIFALLWRKYWIQFVRIMVFSLWKQHKHFLFVQQVKPWSPFLQKTVLWMQLGMAETYCSSYSIEWKVFRTLNFCSMKAHIKRYFWHQSLSFVLSFARYIRLNDKL